MPDFITTRFLSLFVGGFFIGIFAIVVGGAMFVSIPFVQWLCPQATLGAIVGNLKVSSFFRSLGSTYATYKRINVLENLKLMPAALIGSATGAAVISHVDQKWMLPAIITAIAFTILAPKFADKITDKSFAIAAAVTGFYSGFLGAGIGVMLVALLRLKYPEDVQIGFVKIQARFVESLLTIIAVITHFLGGNLIASLWIPLSLGGLIGGYVGGIVLHRMGNLSGNVQKGILYAFFCVDIYVAARKFFE